MFFYKCILCYSVLLIFVYRFLYLRINKSVFQLALYITLFIGSNFHCKRPVELFSFFLYYNLYKLDRWLPWKPYNVGESPAEGR